MTQRQFERSETAIDDTDGNQQEFRTEHGSQQFNRVDESFVLQASSVLEGIWQYVVARLCAPFKSIRPPLPVVEC